MGLDEIYNSALKCKACPLGETRINLVFSDGSENASVMFIGEAPGQNEDETGIPFIGRAGKLLRSFLDEVGFKKEDYYIANTVKCRPPKNRKPTPSEKSTCRHFLDEQIKLLNPKLIVLVGATALESFCDDKKLTITHARGNIFEKDGRKFFPIFHPSYLLRHHSLEAGTPRYLFREDLKRIKELIS